MYNPYIAPPPTGERERPGREAGGRPGRERGPLGGLLGFLGIEQKDAGMAGILKMLGLDGVDTGDVLLLLILLLLVLEGDETEMVVTLALVLLMGLSDRGRDQAD